MSFIFVVVLKLEIKYLFLSIKIKKFKIGKFGYIFLWDKYIFGEGKKGEWFIVIGCDRLSVMFLNSL